MFGLSRRWLPLGWIGSLAFVVVTLAALGSSGATAQAGPANCGLSPIEASDFPSIEDALKFARDNGGGTVHLAAGVHYIEEGIRLYTNTGLCGDGMDVTVIKFAPDLPDSELDDMVGNDTSRGRENITIRDLSIIGRKGARRDCCFGLRLKDVSNVQVINVASDGHQVDGFYLGYRTTGGVTRGVYGARLTGCRARDNGRNGISILHGDDNVVDNCLIADNNRRQEVAGIDLEPDVTLEVTDSRIVGNISQGNNVGIQLFSASRNNHVTRNNAVCENTVRDNKRAGIYDFQGDRNIFVDNDISDSGTNFKVPGNAIVADQHPNCEIGDPPGFSADQVPARFVVKTSTDSHQLAVEAVTKGSRTINYVVSTVDAAVLNDSPDNLQVRVELTLPTGKKKTRSARTGSDDTAEIRFKAKPGQYSARVVDIAKIGQATQFQANPAEDNAGPVTVPTARPSTRPAPTATPRATATPTPAPGRSSSR